MPQSSFETLSKEVDQLGHLIGDVIREMAGDDGFELVEAVRKMIRELRAGNREREDELDSIIANVDNKDGFSEVEMVHFGLNNYGKPSVSGESVGRFKVKMEGFNSAYN